MPVTIQAIEKPLHKIFCNDYAFSIPAYQRPYAWTTEQASELLTDLLSFLGNDSENVADMSPYFLGSIVLIKMDAPEADVVDGQQRLTTLTILLSALRSLLNDNLAALITKFIYQEQDPFAEAIEAQYRLKLRARDEEFFRLYVQDRNGLERLLELDASQLTDSQRNIQSNATYFINALREVAEPERERFAQYLTTRCFLVVVSTPDVDSAYRIFSILNARGLDLSLTDLLKSEVIGAIPAHQQERYTKIWEDEEEDLGRETFQELFSHIRMIYRRTKLRETALSEYRKHIQPQKEPQKFIDEILKPYSDALEIIKAANYQSDREAEVVNSSLRWLNQIDNFDWIPPAILYFSKNSQNSNALKRFFVDLERLAAGLMILRADINERIDRYAKLLSHIQAETDLYEPASPLQLSETERNRMVQTLDGDLYLMKRIRQYVLLRLDGALSEGEARYDYSVITVEHVLPQNPAENSKWLQWFPDDAERSQYVHRIGNLALLSRKKNSEAQNFEFDKKKEKYFKGRNGIAPFVLTTQIVNYADWTLEVIQQRQAELLESLKQVWRV